MTSADEKPSLVDANILVYAASPAVAQYQASRALLESDAKLCVTPQIIAEFFSIVTNSRRVTLPFAPAEARVFIQELLSRVDVLPMLGGIVPRWVALAEKHNVTGPDVFDLQIVATMLENGVRRIHTFNRSDFELFPELEVLTP
jgi:predicted nucleic acid-binding protein